MAPPPWWARRAATGGPGPAAATGRCHGAVRLARVPGKPVALESSSSFPTARCSGPHSSSDCGPEACTDPAAGMAASTVELRALRSVLSRPMPLPRRERRAPALPCLLAVLLAADCGGDRAAAAPQGPPRPLAQSFDFGTISHGKAGEHDFVLDARKELGPGYYPVGTNLDCSCARTLLLLRAADGKERMVGPAGPQQAPREGEVVVVRMQVDTARKEPVDLGPVDSRAMVQFQDRDAPSGAERVLWPLTFRFAVDSPVRVRPFAILDFERVPISKTASLLTSLRSDLPDRPIRFGPVHCDEPRLHLELETRADGTWLRTELRPQPGDAGTRLRALVTIDTDLDTGYQVKLAAIAEITPDLVALPIAKISLRADLRQAQTAERAQSQYVF